MIDKAVSDKFAELKNLRTPYEATWEELARYFNPYREDLFFNMVPGTVIGRHLYDSSGVSCVLLLCITVYL